MAALSGIPAGDKLPESFNVIIEIPADGKAIKYEVDKDSGSACCRPFYADSDALPR